MTRAARPWTALEARAAGMVYPGGVRAVDAVSLAVAEGETVAIIGESGCGKTTLLRMFNRLVEPTSGEVLVGGRPATELDPIDLRRRTGYVQQDGGLLPHWTAGRNVELVPALLGWPAAKRRRRADELLELVGLEPAAYRGRYPRRLSGGERQRVAIARALAADPGVVLLDEPLGALDALTRRDLQRELARIKEAVSRTMVLVTHDVGEALRLGDRVAVMRGGRLLQCGAPDSLRARPAHAYVASLLGAGVNEPGGGP